MQHTNSLRYATDWQDHAISALVCEYGIDYNPGRLDSLYKETGKT